MHHRDREKPDADVLPERAAARLLERASQIDASDTAIADLRAAAAEAGISARAFDAALAEMRESAPAHAPAVSSAPVKRSRNALAGAAFAALVALVGVVVSRSIVPSNAVEIAPPMVEEAVLLRCLSPDQAAELVRPRLGLPGNTILNNPRAPRVLTIRATPEQVQQVHALLDKFEGTGAAACPAPPPATTKP